MEPLRREEWAIKDDVLLKSVPMGVTGDDVSLLELKTPLCSVPLTTDGVAAAVAAAVMALCVWNWWTCDMASEACFILCKERRVEEPVLCIISITTGEGCSSALLLVSSFIVLGSLRSMQEDGLLAGDGKNKLNLGDMDGEPDSLVFLFTDRSTGSIWIGGHSASSELIASRWCGAPKRYGGTTVARVGDERDRLSGMTSRSTIRWAGREQ